VSSIKVLVFRIQKLIIKVKTSVASFAAAGRNIRRLYQKMGAETVFKSHLKQPRDSPTKINADIIYEIANSTVTL
jgi:hypothetical protein